MTAWTPAAVAQELELAAVTLRRLPPAIRRQRLTAWPSIVHSKSEAYGWEDATYREPQPTAADISALDKRVALGNAERKELGELARKKVSEYRKQAL